jgi:hypothetical protein
MRKENQNHHLCAAHIFGTEKARCPEHIYDVRDEKQGRREEDKIKEQSRAEQRPQTIRIHQLRSGSSLSRER